MDSDGNQRPLHVFFIPYFATGHMIPMLDLARLFASRGVHSTLLLTPANAAILRPAIDRAVSSGLPISILTYPFPSAIAGLPPGAENLASVSLSDSDKIDLACPHTEPDHRRLLHLHHPDAVVSDSHFYWISSIADELAIPRFNFLALGLFAICAMRSLLDHKPHLSVDDDSQMFLIPNLPDSISMCRAELPDFIRKKTPFADIVSELILADENCFGVIANSFPELDAGYAECYVRDFGTKVWHVGPVALAAYDGEDDNNDKGTRGAENKANHDRCMEWLDKQKDASVLYGCFGSWCHFKREQLREMALGLETSGYRFLWVVRKGEDESEWMPEGFEERVKDRGLIARGWVPQVAVLGHKAVGGFLTHCGWNSVLEGASAGLPMVTWPLSTEQFINERLVTEVIRIGVRASEGFRSTIEEDKVVVKAEELGKAVDRVMGGGEEAKEMRRRARKYGEIARARVKKGGSCYEGMNRVVEDIRKWHELQQQKKKQEGG